MSKRALILGATGPASLGRHVLPHLLAAGVKPILVGRSADQIKDDPTLTGCEFVRADLMGSDVAETIFSKIGDLSDVSHVIIAGGGPHYKGNLAHEPNEVTQAIWGSIVSGPVRLVQRFHALTAHPYQLVTIASTSAIRRRKDETTYATAQAARAVFAQNFHYELTIRGGSNLIFYPGGMKTGLWATEKTDIGSFMLPADVVEIIWEYMSSAKSDETPLEIIIDRAQDGSGSPVVMGR